MVDKPGRRKRAQRPWKKMAATAVAALVIVAAGYYVYETYVYKAPPVYARVDTTDGALYVELFPSCAPQTVANFVGLANQGYYNDLVWHRILKTPDFWIVQTGDNSSKGGLNSTRPQWGYGGTPATVPLEWCGWLHNYAGYLAMAHTQQSTNAGSQFYINVANLSSNLSLDGNYTVFGRVISGMNVLRALGSSPTCQPPTCPQSWPPDEPLPPVFVNDVVILGNSNPLYTSSSAVSSS